MRVLQGNTHCPVASLTRRAILFEGWAGRMRIVRQDMKDGTMDDLDDMLAGLRDAPAAARFDGLEAAVMQGLDRRRERSVARRSLMLAGVMAIGIGWIGSAVPAQPAQAAPGPLLIGMSDYAPSRLLER